MVSLGYVIFTPFEIISGIHPSMLPKVSFRNSSRDSSDILMRIPPWFFREHYLGISHRNNAEIFSSIPPGVPSLIFPRISLEIPRKDSFRVRSSRIITGIPPWWLFVGLFEGYFLWALPTFLHWFFLGFLSFGDLFRHFSKIPLFPRW